MRRAGPRRDPAGRAVGSALLALAASLLVHGAVLAAAVALFAGADEAAEPLPALVVELVAEPAGGEGAGGAEPEAAGPGSSLPASAEPASEPAATEPRPASSTAVEPAAAVASAPDPVRSEPPPVRPARRDAPRPQRAEAPSPPPRRLAALPPASATVGLRQAEGARAEEHGPARPSGPGPDGGGAPTGGEDALEPPGFVTGSAANPLPRYPTAARRRGVEGTVTLAVRVSADGLPRAVEVARSSGSALLDEAALEAVRRWRFRPARRGAEAVEGRVNVPITFRLVEAEQAALP